MSTSRRPSPIGLTSGNWESGGQVWGSAGIGLGEGLGTGLLYSLMQRPECGYGGDLIIHDQLRLGAVPAR